MNRTYADYAVEKTVELLAVDSPSGYTDAAAEWVRDAFAALGYDAKTGWYVLKADTAVKPLDGYWVYSKGADELTLKYSTAVNTPPAKTVYKGWNAVGLSAEKPMTAKSAFSNLDWVRCMPWDTEQSKWGTVIVNGGSSENSAELKLGLGNGHWLYVEADGTYLGNTA